MRGLDQHKIRKSTYPDISPESSAQLAPGSTNSEKLYQNYSPYVGDTDFLVAETGQIAKRIASIVGNVILIQEMRQLEGTSRGAWERTKKMARGAVKLTAIVALTSLRSVVLCRYSQRVSWVLSKVR